MNLKQLRGWVFDLDGVIWCGPDAMPGAAALVAYLRETGRRVAFLTNNAMADANALSQRLMGHGISAEPRDVISPVAVAGEYLRQRYGQVRVLVTGTPPVVERLLAAGHTIVTDPREAEAVVFSRGPAFGYQQLADVCQAVDRGIPFLTLNNDVRYPVEGGVMRPGLGALVAAVTAATGRQPEVVGKPSAPLFQAALTALGTAPGESVMVGDTPAADTAGALGVGMWSIQVGDVRGEPEAHLRVVDPRELHQLLQR